MPLTWPNCAFDTYLARDIEIFLIFFLLQFLPFFGGKIPANLDIGTFLTQNRRKNKNNFSKKSLCHGVKHNVLDIYAKYEL